VPTSNRPPKGSARRPAVQRASLQTMSRTDDTDISEQSFLSHLFELRSRLLKAVAAVLLILLALIPLANKLYAWLAQPLLDRLPAGGAMIATDVASPFFAPLKLAFFASVF